MNPIERMDRRFNSHEFVLELAYRQQSLYVQALYRYRNSDSPFKIVHSKLAKALKQRDDLVRHIRNRSSKDIFGHSGTVAVWEKV